MRTATRARPRPRHSTGWLVLGLTRKRSATARPMRAQTSVTTPRISIAQAVPVPLNSILDRPRLKESISAQMKRTILTSDQLIATARPQRRRGLVRGDRAQRHRDLEVQRRRQPLEDRLRAPGDVREDRQVAAARSGSSTRTTTFGDYFISLATLRAELHRPARRPDLRQAEAGRARPRRDARRSSRCSRRTRPRSCRTTRSTRPTRRRT